MRSMKSTSFLEPDNAFEFDVQPEPNAISPCSSKITPSCLRALYNTTSYTPTATNVNTLGIAGYLDQFANRADLQVYPFTFLKFCYALILAR